MSSSTMASLGGCSGPKNVERKAAIPAIMATVECAARSGWLERHPPCLSALGADLAEDARAPLTSGDARFRQLLFAQGLR